MNQIDNLTDAANQVTKVVLEDGSILTLGLTYRGATQRWTFDVSHPLLTVAGINLCLHPNLLREWRNLINFGLACVTVTGVDPINVEDFVNGTATLYALTPSGVAGVEQNVLGGLIQ